MPDNYMGYYIPYGHQNAWSCNSQGSVRVIADLPMRFFEEILKEQDLAIRRTSTPDEWITLAGNIAKLVVLRCPETDFYDVYEAVIRNAPKPMIAGVGG